jgi:hypothetical protein
VYAGGRPLWHLSLCYQERSGPVPVLRWSPTRWRKMEAMRDRILFGLGSPEPVIPIEGEERAMVRITMQWRKPLSIAEVAQLADTPEVRAREGRP